uniref:AAA family ATPase n=1 Tax=Shewanella gaetbuli TaxID=220752 RepID=UPI003B5B846B
MRVKLMKNTQSDFYNPQEHFASEKSSVGECINNILSEKIEPPNIIVPHFLVSGEATMLAALAGGAKTFTAQYIAACVATGTPCFDIPITEPQTVLFVDSELSKYQIQQRFKLIYKFIGKKPEEGFLRIIHKRSFNSGMPDLTTSKGFEKLMPDIEASKVIILDNLSSLYRSAEELSQNDWNYYNECLDILREQNKAVLVLHHTDKDSKSYRGHSEIVRAIDNVLIAVKDKNQSTHTKTVIQVRKPKSRHSANRDELLNFVLGDIKGDGKFQIQLMR